MGTAVVLTLSTGGSGLGQKGWRESCAHTAATGKMWDLFLSQLLIKEPTNLLLGGKKATTWAPAANGLNMEEEEAES